MKLTPAQVKNAMRRGLRLLFDPEPEPHVKQAIRAHFGSACAYCEVALDPKDGDTDHLISAALGGENGVANRVLSCKHCNAVEKRDRAWREFLREKAPSEEVFVVRQSRIDEWIEQHGGINIIDQALLDLWEAESLRTTSAFDEACKRIRAARDAVGPAE